MMRISIGQALLAVSLVAFVPTSNAGGQETGRTAEASPSDPTSDRVEAAIESGIGFLLSKQREDGSITDRQYDTTMTSLGIMAMASTGITPSSPGERGESAKRALEFVLSDGRQDKKGYFGNRDGSRMYGHGITTLMLTEMLGMGTDDEQDVRIHRSCQSAIDLILSAQKQRKSRNNFQGGWRYTPNSNDADLSVSVWQLMALRSAKNDGLNVPAEAIANAIAYLRRSYSSRVDMDGQPIESKAGFCYLPSARNPTFTMTAAGLLAMQVCGQYESPLVEGSAAWLLDHPPKWNDRFIFYGTYYYAQGMHQLGGEYATTGAQTVQKLLLNRQQGDGSWQAPSGEESSAGKVYATSMAILSLSVNHHYLPIYQR